MKPQHLKITRRTLLSAAAATPAVLAMERLAFAATPTRSGPAQTSGAFSFVLLGDLHYDKLAHHDMDWLNREKPNDLSQIKNYSRITAEMHPQLFGEVRETIADKQKGAAPMPFVIHAGDFVEGLCGTPQLARTQSEEAIAFVRDAKLNAPFLFCKGNHDITGPGAVEAYNDVFLPYIGDGIRRTPQNAGQSNPDKAYYAFEHGDALFAFFDAYDEASLNWLETTLGATKAKHIFVLIHPPVVPYGARSTWHLYSKPREAAQRARLLATLGRHRAIVLGGHIHKYNLTARRTESAAGAGRFVQLAVCSVISRAEDKPGNILEGVAQYTPDQIGVEPRFSPTTEAERRAALAAEAPFVEHFEYADAPGYAIITVDGDRVEAQMFSGLGKNLWKTRDLSALLRGDKIGA